MSIDIKEQVAQMTEEQKDRIIKIGKISVIVQLVGGIPLLIISLLSMAGIFFLSIDHDPRLNDMMFFGAVILWVFTILYFFGVILFVKIKYPEYSDKKYRYISKERKNKS